MASAWSGRWRTQRALDLDLLVAIKIGHFLRRAVAAHHVGKHVWLAALRLLGELRAQMFLRVVQRVLDQRGIGATQGVTQLLQIFGNASWRIHDTPPCKTLSTESRVAIQAAVHARNASRPGLVMR